MSVGVFLSASGARVTFHAGVMDALSELGIVPDRYVGASGGSIQAVLSASGCQGRLWFDERIPMSRNKTIIHPPLLRNSLKHMLQENFLSEYGGHLELTEINKRVHILSTQRFFRGTAFDHYASVEDLCLKLLASSSLPGFTTFPVKINSKYYADGIFGYFYQRLDFPKLLNTKVIIASLALPTNYRHNLPENAFVFTLKYGKYNPANVVYIREKDARRFYEDGFEQVMHSGLSNAFN